VTIRAATESDLPTLEALWRAFEAEVPERPYVDLDPDEELREIAEIVAGEVALLAEDDGGTPVGFALARRRGPRLARLTDLYVVPEARRRGIARALVREVVAACRGQGLEFIDLEVLASNGAARAVYGRWGFRDDVLTLVAQLDALAGELEEGVRGTTFGSIHVQTDETSSVERAVRQFVPRLPGRSRGSIVAAPRNGWTAVYDDVCDRDPEMLRRLARELSDRMGGVVLAIGLEDGAVVRFILFDRGRIVDEYLSVQEYYGPLPPGDVIALAANPTVVSRLTGADPAAVRAAALHATMSADLPPPRELLARLAEVMKIEGTEHGWSDAPELPGATRIDR
jgi:ribosomal protein S18 acetylase RimI-like enzyme